jgi:hypothetical protein
MEASLWYYVRPAELCYLDAQSCQGTDVACGWMALMPSLEAYYVYSHQATAQLEGMSIRAA